MTMQHRLVCLALVLAMTACSSSEPAASNDAKRPEPKPELRDVATAPPIDEPPKLEPEPVSTANPIVDEPPKPEPAKLPPVEGFFMAEGAPQPRACTTKADCHGDTIPDLAQPCCNDPRSLQPYAFAYRTWINGWRNDHCDAVECPPPPPPAQPPACAFEVDCVERRCVDACK
jgi:hypothetical protein